MVYISLLRYAKPQSYDARRRQDAAREDSGQAENDKPGS
jgi:hypothetical protein